MEHCKPLRPLFLSTPLGSSGRLLLQTSHAVPNLRSSLLPDVLASSRCEAPASPSRPAHHFRSSSPQGVGQLVVRVVPSVPHARDLRLAHVLDQAGKLSVGVQGLNVVVAAKMLRVEEDLGHGLPASREGGHLPDLALLLLFAALPDVHVRDVQVVLPLQQLLCRRAKWAPVAHVESYAAKLFHLHGHSGRDRSALKGRQRSGRDKGADSVRRQERHERHDLEAHHVQLLRVECKVQQKRSEAVRSAVWPDRQS
mmetsp:Transcript_676/g.2583  ORF Transcript_676/g.2583 Transcript_676/m.2583 type:complete len:254 (-) Transcript_676:125-886(-)